MNMIDRSKLAKFYPEVKPEGQNNSVNNVLIEENAVKIPFWRILIITIFLTVAVVSIIWFFNYLDQSVNMNDLTDFVSQLIEIILIWSVIFIVLLIGIFWSLRHIDIKKFVFLVVYALYAIPTSQLTYNLFHHFNNKIVNIIQFSLALFIEDLFFIFLILTIMNSKKMTDNTRLFLFIFTIVYSVAIIAIGNLIK